MSNAYPINVVAINGISKIMIRVESMWISILVSNDAATHLAILLLRISVNYRVTTSRRTGASKAYSLTSQCKLHLSKVRGTFAVGQSC